MSKRIIIAGGRDFSDMEMLNKATSAVLSGLEESQPVIVSGCARGADRLGEDWAHANGWHCEYFPANWEKYGKSAGYRRNVEMAKAADVLVAFWDGKSKGTKHMIDTMKKEGKPTFIVMYNHFDQN